MIFYTCAAIFVLYTVQLNMLTDVRDWSLSDFVGLSARAALLNSLAFSCEIAVLAVSIGPYWRELWLHVTILFLALLWYRFHSAERHHWQYQKVRSSFTFYCTDLSCSLTIVDVGHSRVVRMRGHFHLGRPAEHACRLSEPSQLLLRV